MKRLMRALVSLFVVLVVFAQPAQAATTYGKTKYPIVLVHGFLGWSAIGGVYDYFNFIPTALRNNGATVYVALMSQSNSSAVRGEQLLVQVQQVLAATGATKVNLIGHSMGGLDSRYVAAVRPDLVASVSTVASPHLGSPVADAISGWTPTGQKTLADIVSGISQLMAVGSGGTQNPQDPYAALASLSTPGMAAFNAKYPAGVPASCSGNGALTSPEGIRFYSWGGTGVLTNPLDLTDLLFALTGTAFNGSPDHDGMVGRCSSHFGLVIKDNYFMNHLDDVNQILGLNSFFTPNPVTLFQQHANRLKLAGV